MRYNQLLEVIDEEHPRSIMEIGTWRAVNAVKMIEQAARYTPKDDIVYYGFDLWEEMTDEEYLSEFLHPKAQATYKEAKKRLDRTGIEYHLHKGNTKETLPGFVPSNPIDMFWIDGGHSPETIRSDWMNIQRFMHEGSIVLFDDYCKGHSDFGSYEIINEIIDTERFAVWILSSDDKTASGLNINIAKVAYDTF